MAVLFYTPQLDMPHGQFPVFHDGSEEGIGGIPFRYVIVELHSGRKGCFDWLAKLPGGGTTRYVYDGTNHE